MARYEMMKAIEEVMGPGSAIEKEIFYLSERELIQEEQEAWMDRVYAEVMPHLF